MARKFKENYIPGSQSFAEGFLGPKGNVGFIMLVDEKKAKKIIEELKLEDRGITEATLGLNGDWQENNTVIYKDGEFKKYDAYFGSCWAKPILIVEFTDIPSRTYQCWKKGEKYGE